MAEEDIMWGKKRHLYGGIEPSNMLEFTAEWDSVVGSVKIVAILPNDTVVDGQMLCAVGGAVIRRKLTGYPVDEFDGEELINISDSIEFFDTDTEAGNTYFYAAFPYSAQGVYNRSASNRASVNMPGDMTVFTATRAYSEETGLAVKITYELPDNATGAYICKNSSIYPMTEAEGLLLDVTESGVYLDTDVNPGETYYYSAFPYSGTGIVNRNATNRTSIKANKAGYIFGYDIDISDSNPNTRVTYPQGVDNVDYIPAAMNFEDDIFNYGSWPSEAGDKFMPRPCTIKADGTVYEYLNQYDYSGAGSNRYYYMMEWPKIYTHRELVNGVYKFRCSDVKIDDTWECWCNYDRHGNEIDHFYTAIYRGTHTLAGSTDRNLWSRPGDSNKMTNVSYSKCVEYALNVSPDAYIEQYSDVLLIQDLLVMMAKTTDCQSAYGTGLTGNNAVNLNNGSMDNKGLFWGTNNYYTGVKVFGMEHWWGNQWRYMAGLIGNSGSLYGKFTYGKKDGSTVVGYNSTGDGYIDLNTKLTGGLGFIKDMLVTEYGRIPYGTGGSSTTYEADLLSYSSSSGVVNIAVIGGREGSGMDAKVGPFTTSISYTAGTYTDDFTARLSFKPSKEVTT